MLASPLDQAQEMGCELFREALEKVGVQRTLWETPQVGFVVVWYPHCWTPMWHALVTRALCRL